LIAAICFPQAQLIWVFVKNLFYVDTLMASSSYYRQNLIAEQLIESLKARLKNGEGYRCKVKAF
jgi:hypothetical protein